ncbi:MAG: endo-1,4-beta-xylanase [Phycisphaerales bacterium]
MLLFAVFDDAGPAAEWPLRHAYLVGGDDMVLAGEVSLEQGLLRCERRQEGACGLGIQFPVVSAAGTGKVGGGQSLLTLRTCLLPQRTQPYLLSLELARHRLMLMLNKLEEWAFFDLAADDPMMVKVEETRLAFTAALLLHRSTPPLPPPSPSGAQAGAASPPVWFSREADRAARHALNLAVDASEDLARKQAHMQHARRLSGETARAAAMTPPPNAITDHEARASRAAALGTPGVLLAEMPRTGISVSPAACTPELQAAVQATCDFLQMPMRWVDMEPTEGKYAFAKTDKWLEWAVTKAKLPVVAGPLVELRPGAIPDFLYIWEHDYETLKEVVFEHCKTLVTRYRKVVGTWIVASGLPCGGVFKLTYEQVIDLTRTCVLLVRKLQPSAKVVVEIAQPWGEYNAGPAQGSGQGWKAIPPTLYAELLNQLGLNIDALGVRLQMGHNLAGRSTRDPMSVSALLDRYANLDRPLMVSALGAPSLPPPAPTGPTPKGEAATPPDPGSWRGTWSPQQQARWLTDIATIAAGKPFVQSICWQELCDLEPGGEMPGGGLLTAPGAAKPALAAFQALHVALKDRTPL